MATSPEHSLSRDVDTAGQSLEIGARLQHGPSQTLIGTAFQAELNDQQPLFDALSRADLAHTLVLTENAIIPRPEGCELIRALCRLRQQPPDFNPDPASGDLYTNRESWLIAHTPAGQWLGAGRARREAITTAYVIKLRAELLTLLQSLIDFGHALTARSEHYRAALLPDYTYLQAAQPTSFGHYLLAFAYPVLRDIERIQGLYRRLNQSPAGCGSSNGSRLPQARERLAQLLGFDGCIAHARDAMWQADLQIELAAALTAMLINMDRLAEDLQIFATEEFALVELDDRHARASKIMPQKKNPFALTHIRGLANAMIGTLTSTAAAGRTPTGQPDNRLALYGAIPRAIVQSAGAVVLMKEVVESFKFNERRARARLEHGFAHATDLAEMLVLEAGISFREAHRLVGTLVRRHLDRGGFHELSCAEIAECSADLLGRAVELSAAALDDALIPESCVAARKQPGGAAAPTVAAMIGDCRQTLVEAAGWWQQTQARLATAEAMLEQSIEACLSSRE